MSTGTELTTAGRLLDALSCRDFAAFAACCAPDVRMRALVPPGVLDLRGPAEVRARLEHWFGGDDDFEVVEASIGEVGARLSLRWRIRKGEQVVEQHVFTTGGADIATIDLLCSGWVDQP